MALQLVFTILLAVVVARADHEYMVSKAHSITVAINFETKLECLMNIEAEHFQWKFYPLDKKDACNPKARISLTTSPFQFVHPSKYENTTSKKMSSLILQADSNEIAGDYQCLAHYGASVVASVPWRVTITNLTNFTRQEKLNAVVVAGNTINWRCDPPPANPEPYVDYLKDGTYYKSKIFSKSLIIPKVSVDDSGTYTCRSGNVEGSVESKASLSLTVVKQGLREPPRFLIPPKTSYYVTKDETVFLECAAIGNPIPTVTWMKRNAVLPTNRIDVLEGNGGMTIRNVTKADDGIYECFYRNDLGTITHSLVLHYQEAPAIDCYLNSTEITQGKPLDLQCEVTGTPKPEISWFLNGFVVNDSNIRTDRNKIFFTPAEKRHAGNLQIFARNVVGTEYSSILIKVFPLSTTQENSSDAPIPSPKSSHRKNNARKHGKMIPPSKPTIQRTSDESVLLRWNTKDAGLPISFIKVQYRDLGPANQHDQHGRGNKGSKWNTLSQDIPPYTRSYEIGALTPDHYYRFRIAAVYSNNDNKNSPNSEKFLLKRMDFDNRNPLPVPFIEKVVAINTTAAQIYWKCDNLQNSTVAGYIINYNSASSAGDYQKETVDGKETTSYVLAHLQSDTVYDIKLQTFSDKSISDFSNIHKVKTLALVTTTTTTLPTITQGHNDDSPGISKLYIIIAASVLGACGFIAASVALLLCCRKWKKKKMDDDKRDEHHIQADGNEYVVTPKSARTNGCVSNNRITITANPLADADNKNQNMIEMSCLSSQNNNCSQAASASAEDSPPAATNSRDKKNKTREKRIRNKHNAASAANDSNNTSGENYV